MCMEFTPEARERLQRMIPELERRHEQRRKEQRTALAEKRFHEESEKIFLIIQNYLSKGYAEHFAKLLVYLGSERAEKAIETLPKEMQESVRTAYAALSTKSNTDADIISEAGMVLSRSEFSGKEAARAILEGLTPVEAAAFTKGSDSFFTENPILSLNLEQNNFLLFEDLVDIDDRSIQKILREVDSPELAKALKSVDSAVQEKIFRNMSKRAAAMLQEDMEFMGPVRLKDVEEAQQKIVGVIHRLLEVGEIVLPVGGDALVM